MTVKSLGWQRGESVPIRVLPATVAAGIAAGEVVERPASVVKELVENSLDADATHITVELRHGGLEQITVSDDGCGIPQEEMELAFARHATSKLQGLDDLADLTTMGFRGEALPSIAAAGLVTMVSRTAGSDSACAVDLVDGTVSRKRTVGAAPGTTVTVDDLFAGIPARRKYLRSQAAETARVRQVVEHLAMASPTVQFTFVSDGRLLLQTPGSGSLRDMLAVVYGAETAQAMLEIGPTAGPYPVHGLVSPAEVSRPSRAAISLFVNRRWVQHRTLVVAIEGAYQGFLMEGRYPIVALFLEVPPAQVDVNVHPTKREVRFLRDGDAFTSVQRAVRETLLAESPLMEARGAIGASLAPSPGQVTSETSGELPLGLSPALQPSPSLGVPAQGPAPDSVSQPGAPSPLPGSGTALPPLRVLGQVANTYLVAEGPDGMYLVDQHAAHEQALFDRLLLQWERGQPDVQPLLDPLPVELAPEQLETAHELLSLLPRLGLHVEPFGERTWLVRALPAMASRSSIPRLLEELFAPQRDPSLVNSQLHYALAASIACHSSVRAGQALGIEEMNALVTALAAARNPHHCPHGRPTIIRVSTTTLERQFGRT